MDNLQKAAAAVLENLVPIPDKESVYVTRFHVRGLKDALEAETNRRDKQAEEIVDSRELLINIHGAVEAGMLDEMVEVCGYIADHLARMGVCVSCGEVFFSHNPDGSCVRD